MFALKTTTRMHQAMSEAQTASPLQAAAQGFGDHFVDDVPLFDYFASWFFLSWEGGSFFVVVGVSDSTLVKYPVA